MIRPYELFIGLRYTRAKRRNHFISFISMSSMLGTALGVMALITVLSVMNGFGKELRTRILGVASHLTISGDNGRLRDSHAVEQAAAGFPEVLGTAPYVQGQGMLTRGKIASGIVVRGILPEAEPRVADIGDKMVSGGLDLLKPGEFGIILGRDLAWKLDVDLGARLALVVPEGQVTAAGLLPRMKRFTVVGIFEIGMYEYDSSLALIHIEDAALLYQMSGQVSGVRLKITDVYAAPELADQLEEKLGQGYHARDWTREHANYFRALKMEKTVMFIILLLIVAVAAFNIVSTLVMVVADKEAEIAILRTLGATPRSIMAIFMVQGTVIGVVGTLLGVISGIALAQNVDVVVPFLERVFSTTFLAKDVYYISDLPSDMHWSDVWTITIASLLMGFLATLYPAWRAAQIQPAEALRYE